MRLERVALVIVAVAVLIVLAVPFWRGLALSQLRQTVRAPKSVWTSSIDASIPSAHPKSDTQLLKEHPNDFLLRLALAEERLRPSFDELKSSRRAKQTIHALLRDFPQQPAVYELAMNMPEYERVCVPQRIEAVAIIPEDAAGFWHDPGPPTKEQLDGCRRCIEMLNRVIAVDSGNGWFHFQKASYLYGLHRDAEAISEIHLAASSPRFTDCAPLRLKACDHLCDLRGVFDPEKFARSKLGMRFPYVSTARETARITAHLAYRKISQGRRDEGVRLALDVADAGYKMSRDASVMIDALVGNTLTVIGTAALDPAFECKDGGAEERIAAYALHGQQYLANHGYRHEAAVLRERSQQTDRLRHGARSSVRDSYASMDTLRRFPIVFIDATAVLAITIVVALLWLVSSLVAAKLRTRDLCDRRAGATSAFLCSLIFAPIAVDFVRSLEEEGLRQNLSGDAWFPPDPLHVDPKFLIIPAAAMALALVIGFIVMLRRTPKDGRNRAIPAPCLLVLYLAAFGALMYLHCEMGLNGIPSDYGIDEHAPRLSYVQLVYGPAVLLVLYALVRAIQSRFGRARRRALPTFVATLRYGSAVVVALMVVGYLCLMPLVAQVGARAEGYARFAPDREAALIRSAFK